MWYRSKVVVLLLLLSAFRRGSSIGPLPVLNRLIGSVTTQEPPTRASPISEIRGPCDAMYHNVYMHRNNPGMTEFVWLLDRIIIYCHKSMREYTILRFKYSLISRIPIITRGHGHLPVILYFSLGKWRFWLHRTVCFAFFLIFCWRWAPVIC